MPIKRKPPSVQPQQSRWGQSERSEPYVHSAKFVVKIRCQGKEAEAVETLIYAASSDESSRGIILSTKASDSILLFSGICASRPLPAAQNFPKAIPTTTATDNQISSMNIMFNASPLIFHREKLAMNMPNHREESEVLEKNPHRPSVDKSRWGLGAKTTLVTRNFTTTNVDATMKKRSPKLRQWALKGEWFNLTLDVVVGSQEAKFRLKYDISSFQTKRQSHC
jgi:hypothetical protein